MWKLIKISQKTYFMYCNVDANKQEVTFVLYDLKETWSQTLTLNQVKQKVKALNKRFDFSEDNIKEALTSDMLQFAAIEEQPNTSTISVDSCLLKLKYRVKNCLLTYEWSLRKQTLLEFQQTFVQPLLVALLECHQQVDILTESLRKKDLEIKQYRIEGAVLNRKTLATKPFDFDDFNKKYEGCNKIAITFKELAKYIKENDSKEVPDHLNCTSNKIEKDIKPEEKQNDTIKINTKISPRQKKRKAKEIKLQHLEQHLKLRKQGLEYESSQSQTPSSGDSQTTKETEVKEIKQKDIAESKSDKTSTPRKTTRCAPSKQKMEYLSSEDKTDSENDEHLKIFRKSTSTNNTANFTKNTTTNSAKEHTTNKVENNIAEETTRKCVKSLNLSKPPEKSSEISNIYAFTSDSDDDKPLINRILQSKNSLRGGRGRLHNISNEVKNTTIANVVSTDLHLLKSKNLSYSPTPVMDDISSQLNSIKKELECLEAMRLADLKQRIC